MNSWSLSSAWDCWCKSLTNSSEKSLGVSLKKKFSTIHKLFHAINLFLFPNSLTFPMLKEHESLQPIHITAHQKGHEHQNDRKEQEYIKLFLGQHLIFCRLGQLPCWLLVHMNFCFVVLGRHLWAQLETVSGKEVYSFLWIYPIYNLTCAKKRI